MLPPARATASLNAASALPSGLITIAWARAALVSVKPFHCPATLESSIATDCAARPSLRILALRTNPTTATDAIARITRTMNSQSLVAILI